MDVQINESKKKLKLEFEVTNVNKSYLGRGLLLSYIKS